MKKRLRRFEVEVREFFEFLAIPFIGACLPYPIGLRWFKLMARMPWIYAMGIRAGFDNAVALGLAHPNEYHAWSIRTKLIYMIDNADVFYLLTRGKRFFNKYVSNNFSDIDWDDIDIVYNAHFGAGGWFHYYLKYKKLDAVLLVNPFSRTFWFSPLWARRQLYRLREYAFTKRLSTRFVSPGDLLEIRKVLKNKEIIIVCVDVPVKTDTKSYQLHTSLGKLNLTASFFKLAERRKLTAANVVFGFDYASGKRDFLAVRANGTGAKSHAQAFARLSTQAISERPWLWHMMQLAKELLVN